MLLHPVTWLLLAFPGFYWAMGLCLTALGNSFSSIWNVPKALSLMIKVPFEYLAIVIIGAVSGSSLPSGCRMCR